MNEQLLQFLSACKQNFDYYEGLERSYGYTKQHSLSWIIITILKLVFLSPIFACFLGWFLKLIYIGDYIDEFLGRNLFLGILIAISAFIIAIFTIRERKDDVSTVKSIEHIFSSPQYQSFYQQAASVLGEKYCTAHACGKFLEYISSGRCADLMMAKNIYEQELAQERVEKAIRDRISADIATEQREQSEKEATAAAERNRMNNN